MAGAGQVYCQPCKAVTVALRGVSAPLQKPEGPRRIKVAVDEGNKWCAAGQHEVPLTSFKPKRASCIPCERGKALAYRLKAVYNLTPSMYEAILEHQGGCCAICGMKPRTKRLHVDHAHKGDMRVRGLLCSNCNSGVLASAKDDPEVLRRAATYLEVPPAIEALGIVVTANEIANGRPKKRGFRRRRK